MLVKICVLVLLSVLNVVFAVRNETYKHNGEEDQLIFAQIIYRHGARNIVTPIPNDPSSDESNWPGGYGALTDNGKEQLFVLGKYFRNRYLGNLLGNGEYSPEKVYVFSTDKPRTMMSAAANLAGLFSSNSSQQWNNDLLRQPIPIHVPFPLKDDYYVAATKVACERFTYLRKQLVDKLTEDKKELFKYLEKNLNKTIEMLDAFMIFDTLFIESLNNMTLPKWSEKIFYPGCDLEIIFNDVLKMYSYTKEISRLKHGFLLREIMDRFLAKANSTLEPDYNLYFYSAHELTIASLMNMFGLYDAFPPYASALMFELNQSNDGYYVQMFYKNSTTENHLLDIPNCGTKCPLEKLYELSQPYFPETDFETGCKLHDDEKSSSTMLCPILSVSLISITAIFLLSQVQFI